ncbi:hypothetical protein AC93_5508 [Escherichia coli 2-005-03_S4_C2]|nr:hypothetical protein AC93_5508 [Escherichia coli 2-005-03_S4_C2]KDT34470.1 hypothetical protein AC67_5171 [Escherichia coli 2-052-05_S4_C1]
MLTSFPLNAGVAEQKPAALLYKVFPPSCSYASGWLLNP